MSTSRPRQSRSAAASPRRRAWGVWGALSGPPLLLPPLVGGDAGEGEEVGHLEVAGDPAAALRQRRLPVSLREVGIAVELQHPEEDLADDPAADGPQVLAAVAQHASLAERVEPQRRGVVEVEVVGP